MTDDSHDRHGRSSRRTILAASGTLATSLLGGCLSGGGSADGDTETGATDGAATTDGMATETATPASDEWLFTELSAVRGGETFTVDSLTAPVVIQSFAVWCPKCKRLSNQLAQLDGTYTLLGLNTDPNEDAAKVRQHAEENDFSWRFAVAPTEMTESLVDRFGSTVVNAPSTPVIVVCESGTATFLSGSDSTRPTIRETAEEC
ncbi:TlpA family protein disulfide reductase [Halobellus marinus]|uniref:TlpA family protein disulfide reductase n=1 Tax=Halobellus TaxID=1073986 RepID=UPI0028AB6F10|nr:TlpA family protein disulfide reductase [Halobellus sp. DFY28]